MAIQILGGKFKGRKLKVPAENITRPTSVVLRRKIFDANQSMENILFIDLCAGSGAMGLEAASRGAEKVIFIESNPKASIILKQNVLHLTGQSKAITIEMKDAIAWLKNYKFQRETETILFFDPPYENHSIYEKFLQFMKQIDADLKLKIWVESDETKGLNKSFWSENGFDPSKIYSQGQAYIAVIIP